jgi:diadenosine tetraphosphatase ApaH/serine/threonine PP2A family protein phosphatase/dienelactone hydrolase
VSAPTKHAYDRIPYLVAYQNTSGVRDVYGGVAELVVLESYLLKPDTASDTVLVFMHPIGGGAYLPMINALARAGHHVIYCNSRFRGTDSALLMEKVVEDLGECIKDAKNRLGYAKVVLAGWSGGGSLSAFYQQQAQHPTVTASPSGDGPDLTKLGLIPADGIMLLAAHVSRHGTMTEWLDASILDESDPSRRDPELDLYDPANPNQPPYTAEFLERYRAAQIARNRRITAWVKDKLAALRAAGRPDDEFAFVVHGTMADPRWLDPTVDPNERTPGTCYLGDPQVVNNSPVGLARFCTLRSWLSQWSYDDANGDAVKAGPDIAVPGHTRRLFEAIGHPDKEIYEIPGANHYYAGPDQRDTLRRAVGICTDWLQRHGFSK